MEDLLELTHTTFTNWVGAHPKGTGLLLLFAFVLRPMSIAFLKDAFPKSVPPTGQELLRLPAIQVILQKPLTTPADQAAAIDALVRVVSPPAVRPPLVAGLLAALGVTTNIFRWIMQRVGITPPTEDVLGSAEVRKP